MGFFSLLLSCVLTKVNLSKYHTIFLIMIGIKEIIKKSLDLSNKKKKRYQKCCRPSCGFLNSIGAVPSISLELISLGDKCVFSHLKEETAAHFSHVCCRYEFKLQQFTITHNSLFNKKSSSQTKRYSWSISQPPHTKIIKG